MSERLIDANALDEKYVTGAIISAPTVDAVRVVRCKDCKWAKEAGNTFECRIRSIGNLYHDGDYYCADGEPKGGAE